MVQDHEDDPQNKETEEAPETPMSVENPDEEEAPEPEMATYSRLIREDLHPFVDSFINVLESMTSGEIDTELNPLGGFPFVSPDLLAVFRPRIVAVEENPDDSTKEETVGKLISLKRKIYLNELMILPLAYGRELAAFAATFFAVGFLTGWLAKRFSKR